ncbi:hypothetical protein [Amycolatopsis panacis]|uniref:Uncharacterized protein n=1 Tax=Amycolatopsis panacis TaxID=2340917 RepID=A0A419I9X5_9PSEU|nr:hypothetical protein [Amycolatopsis panacis]RJQ89310.1 hypothetical protein D5S19_04935 [Amycolatopsis panacis]
MTADLLTTRDYEARTGEIARAQPKPKQSKTQETTTMLLHEELSRARIRDFHTEAEAQRPWRRARAARRWTRLARWAANHAKRHLIQD